MSRLEELLKVTYVKDGRDEKKDGGLDCWGFSREYMKAMGAENIPPVFSITGEDAKKIAFSENEKSSAWIKLKRPQSCMIVLFRFFSGKYHCGVICDDGISFYHNCESGVKRERLDSPLWKRITVGFYRYAGELSNEQKQ